MNLHGSVSVVTGAGRGIGRAIALALSSQGSKVAVVSRTKVELEETVRLIVSSGGQAKAFVADISNEKSVSSLVTSIQKDLGAVTILINNAGTSSGTGPVWLSEPREWWRTFEVNLLGPYLLSRQIVPVMAGLGGGYIINVASNAAIGPQPYAAAYSCSKAGLMRLTDSLAESTTKMGVRVFAISPGWVWTSMTEQAIKEIKAHDPDFKGIPDNAVFPPEMAGNLVLKLIGGTVDALSGRYFHVADDFEWIEDHIAQIIEEDLYALRLRTPEN